MDLLIFKPVRHQSFIGWLTFFFKVISVIYPYYFEALAGLIRHHISNKEQPIDSLHKFALNSVKFFLFFLAFTSSIFYG